VGGVPDPWLGPEWWLGSDVGVASTLQRACQKGLHLLVNVLTDATHLRLGDAALGTQRRHQGIHPAGGDPTDVGLHDHGIQDLIDAAARIEGRKLSERSYSFVEAWRLGDLQCQISHLGGEGAGSVAVAVAEPRR
jgi:hypothetical protein